MKKALTERRELIQQRAEDVLDQALSERQEWAVTLGDTPTEAKKAAACRRHVETVAAYDYRYGITTRTSLSLPSDSDAQKIELPAPNRTRTPPRPQQLGRQQRLFTSNPARGNTAATMTRYPCECRRSDAHLG